MNTPRKKDCCEQCSGVEAEIHHCDCHPLSLGSTPPQEKGWPKEEDDLIMDFHFRRDNSEEDNKDTYEFATKLITATEERVRDECKRENHFRNAIDSDPNFPHQ